MPRRPRSQKLWTFVRRPTTSDADRAGRWRRPDTEAGRRVGGGGCVCVQGGAPRAGQGRGVPPPIRGRAGGKPAGVFDTIGDGAGVGGTKFKVGGAFPPRGE